MSTIKFHGPFTTDLRICVTNGDLDAVITYSLPMGKIPTPEMVDEACREALDQAPAGFRLMTKREWWEMECKERFGQVAAMPGGAEWDKAGEA